MRLNHALLALALFGLTSPAQGAVRLQFISDCGLVERTRDVLNMNNVECRRARGSLEQKIAASLRGSSVCFFDSGEPVLRTFSCYLEERSSFRAMSCFRPVPVSDLEEYEKNYSTQYAQAVKDYLDAAAMCPIGNGDPSPAYWTLFDGSLIWIARFRFGFVLPIGKGLVGQHITLHGYADVDPDLVRNSAIEFYVTDLRG